MSERQLWERYKRYLCVVRVRRADARRVAHELRRRLPRADARPAWTRPSTRWRRWRRAPSPTRTRSAWSATTGCAPRSSRPTPELAQRDRATRWRPSHAFAADVHAGEREAAEGGALHARAGRSASAARRSGRSSSRTRWARRRDRDAGRSSSTTPTPTASTACSAQLGDRLAETLRRGHQQARRHQGDAQRHARGRARLPAARASTSARTRSPSPARAASSTSTREQSRLAAHASRCGTGSAAAPASCPRWACCPPRCRASTSTACSPARATWTRRRASATTRKNPAALLALDVVPRRRRARREGHGRPALQGPAAAASRATCSSS